MAKYLDVPDMPCLLPSWGTSPKPPPQGSKGGDERLGFPPRLPAPELVLPVSGQLRILEAELVFVLVLSFPSCPVVKPSAAKGGVAVTVLITENLSDLDFLVSSVIIRLRLLRWLFRNHQTDATACLSHRGTMGISKV